MIKLFLDRNPIKYKIIYSILPFLIISYAILLCSIVFGMYFQMKSTVSEQFYQHVIDKGDQLDAYLKDMDEASVTVLYNKKVQKAIENIEGSMDFYEYNQWKSVILQSLENSTILNNRANVYRIMIQNTQGELITNHELYPFNKDDVDTKIENVKDESRVRHGNVYLSYDRNEHNSLILSRMVYENNLDRQDHEIALFIMDINLNKIVEMFKRNSNTDQMAFLLFSDKEELVLNTSLLTEEDCLILLKEKELKSHKNTYTPVIYELSYSGYKMIGVINNTNVYQQVHTLLYVQLGWIVLSIVIIAVSIVVTSNTISKQFDKFIRKIRGTSQLDDTAYIHFSTKDEFHTLAEVYNLMLVRINALKDTINAKEILAQNAQLKAFQAQINPHFLYNTLDCIGGLVDLGKPEETKKTISCLASIMRMSIKGNDFLTVKEDIEYITQYIYIQKIRCQDRVLFLVDVDESINDYLVPKLILQPLIENSVLHGVGDMRSGGMVMLTGTSEDDYLVFKVQDNGKGFSEDVIQRFKEQEGEGSSRSEERVNKEAKGSMGLWNIQERIRHLCGKKYGLEIRNLSKGGSAVTVIIPKKSL
ncbi:sensor histidine kinase [Paenibacillus lutimineralis]|uniref:Uncharacterized protein n=1 Tax=Paenibacillus lutimineralis TaxID=2707005 RepID=A0A3Q9I9C4_9BACL|nr:histidine kinase [Paenibacillus lutimineralis]AZS13224.1 hypothetical protein EI981_01135 [Paenibacillus lutimineralis]